MLQKITSQTLCELRFAASPRFSPDGSCIAYTVKKAKADKKGYESDIYLARAGKKPVRLTGMGDAHGFSWTKEGTLLFSAMRDKADKDRAAKKERFGVMYELDVRGGEAVRAFELPYPAGELTQLDDGRFYFSARIDTKYPADKNAPDYEEKLKEYAAPTYRALEESPFWFNGAGFTDGIRRALFLFDRASGELTRVTPEDFEPYFTSDDGVHILYTGDRFRKVHNHWKQGLYLYDTVTGETQELIAPETIDVDFAYMWNEGEVLVSATHGETYGRTQSGELMILSLADKSLRPLGDTPIIPAMGHVNTDARLGGGLGCKMTEEGFYFITLRGYQNVLCLLKRDGTIEEILTAPHGVDAFDVFDGHLVYTLLSNANVPEIVLDGEAITDEGAFLKDYEVSVPEYIPFTNKDGVEIDGWLMRPAGYEPGKSYPALFEIHGGPRTAFGDTFFHEMQMFTSAGYFVFFCNPRGSDGKGDAFADIWGRYGSIDYDDLMAFTDHVLATTPDIDAKRVGVLGGSYGGYMTNWIIGHTDRFAAACSQRSIASWISFEFTADIGGSFTLSQHKTTTHEDVHALWDISPLKYADRAVTPTLFIHSDHDFRCWMVEGIQMFTALKMHGVDSRLCLFADETHELSRSGKPENRIARLDEMMTWFDKYLKKEEEKNA